MLLVQRELRVLSCGYGKRKKCEAMMVELIIITAFFGMVLYYIAAKRKADKVFWLAMGIVFGPFALPFVFFAKTKDTEDEL